MIGGADIINTIYIGLVYTVMAIPLTLSYKATGIINFPHINFITYGAYTAILLHDILGVNNVFIAALTAFLVGGVISIINNLSVFQSMLRRKTNLWIIMIASMGLWIFYKYLLYSVLDVLSKIYRINFISRLIRFSTLPTFQVGGLELSSAFSTTLILSAILLFGLYLFLERTTAGKAIGAISDNPVLAEISGIPKDKVINIMWFVVGGMTAVGGLMWVIFSIATPEIGDWLILVIFAIAVIGGLHSLTLTALGAFIIAAAENIGLLYLNQAFGVPTSYKPFISFLTLLIVIIVWPPKGAGGGLPYRFLTKRKSFRGENK